MTRRKECGKLTSTKEVPAESQRGEASLEKKLRYSHQREMIYQYLLMSKEHPSAEMIYDGLREMIPDLSLGTVYRNLKLLEQIGKIRRVTSYEGSERYDAICGDHVHFLCESCGSVRDVVGANTELLRESIALEQGYKPSKLDLTITGRCPRCSQ